jgi:cation diffusion facilitator family transporter
VALASASFWPGIPMYDTVSQYDQVLSNDVTDWHPPVMVRLWQLLHPLADGTAPMFVLQVVLYALGVGLIVAALVRAGRRWGAITAAVVALSPMLFGWEMVVLKDTQMQAALMAAVGIVAWYRLAGRHVPAAAAGAAAVLILYATLVRANAVFVTAPLGILLIQTRARLLKSVAGSVAAIGILLALSPAIDHQMFGASDSGVAKSQPLFDLAAIALATPADAPSPFTPAERRQLAARHCVKSFFWDPLGDPSACGPITDRFNEVPERDLYFSLARAAAAHPVSYGEHRLMHWNSTERWLVSPGLTDAGPPDRLHPFGYGRELYFWSFVVAVLVFSLGAGVSVYEGYLHILHPEPPVSPLVAYVVLVVAFLLEGWSTVEAFGDFKKAKGDLSWFQAVRRSKDPPAFIVLLENGAAMAGIIAAAIGLLLSQLTGNPLFDGAASVVIGVILALTAMLLAHESKGLLIGESADPVLVEKIRQLACDRAGVVGVGHVLTLHSSPDQITVMMNVDFRDDMLAGEVERIVCQIEEEARERWPAVKRLFVRPMQGAAAQLGGQSSNVEAGRRHPHGKPDAKTAE